MPKQCADCGKEYDDSYEKCPHCGSEQLSDKKKCPYCAEWIQKDAIRCRYCHANLTDSAIEDEAGILDEKPKQPRNRALLKKALIITSIVLFIGACAGVSTFFIIRHIQRGHYQTGLDYLESEDYKSAIKEFEKAGGYSDASIMCDLTTMYVDILSAMNQSDWKEAYSLIQDIQEEREGFLDVLDMKAFLELYPESPVTFSLHQVQSSGIYTININNLIGEKIDAILVYRGWNYENHGRPDYISSIVIHVGLSSQAVVAAFDNPKVRQEGAAFYMGAPGAEFDLAGYSINYHFQIVDASINSSPTGFSDIRYGYDPVFNSLTISITASMK